MIREVFSGKRVLITGHTGFKGAWLSLWLAELGAEVYGYALTPPTQPNLFEAAEVRNTLAGHKIGDVRDLPHLQDYLAKVKPQFVFHLAAQPLVRLSYEQPVETYATNVMGTVHLLEVVRRIPSVRVCQIITSDKCYENREWVYAYRENDPMGGFDPYSSSKGCAELVVSAYRQSFFPSQRVAEHGVSLSSVRAGNVIGGGDWAADRIIPDCIRSLIRKAPIPVRNPHAIRPWQHVLEPLSGYLTLAARQFQEPGRFEEAWNFGPMGDGNLTVAEIVEQVVRHWGEGRWVNEGKNDTASWHEARFLKLDITKARDVLGWRPLWSVDVAIKRTVQWYKAWHNGMDMSRFTRGQIQEYMELAGWKEDLCRR